MSKSLQFSAYTQVINLACLDLDCNMEHIHEFFDTTSINGITFIKKSKGFARLFWILVVIGGFSGAVFMLNESFDNWRKNPISTKEETKPISDITFPNITICPPNIILNLNHDIKNSEAVTLNNDIRDELIDFAQDVIDIKFYDDMMANLREAFKKYLQKTYGIFHMLVDHPSHKGKNKSV